MGKKKQKKPAEMRPALTGPVQRSESESENEAPEANPIDAELRVDRGHKEDATIAADEIEAFAKKKKQKKPAEMRPALTGPVQRSEGESENKAPEANPVDAKLRVDRGNKKDATIAVEEIQAFVKKKKPKKPADMRINNTKKEERINIETLQKSKKNNEDRRIEQNDKVERGETLQKSKKKHE